MTPEEKRKYRWLKPLAYTVAWGIEYPARFILVIVLLVPALIFEKTSDLLSAVHDFLSQTFIFRPINYIFSLLGFFELHKKAKRGL